MINVEAHATQRQMENTIQTVFDFVHRLPFLVFRSFSVGVSVDESSALHVETSGAQPKCIKILSYGTPQLSVLFSVPLSRLHLSDFVHTNIFCSSSCTFSHDRHNNIMPRIVYLT